MSTSDTTKGISPADMTQIMGSGGPGQTGTRWGIDAEPQWYRSAEQIAPLALAVLATHTVTAGKSGYIFGVFISCQEANNFLINWTSGGVAYSMRVIFGGAGSMESVDPVSMNSNLPADAGTAITVTNVTAGGVGVIYQAALLVGEV